MSKAKKLSEVYTVHYGRVDFLVERFDNGFTIEKGDAICEKISAYAVALADKYDVDYDNHYFTQWDGHQFSSDNLDKVTACTKALESYVRRFKGIRPAIEAD